MNLIFFGSLLSVRFRLFVFSIFGHKTMKNLKRNLKILYNQQAQGTNMFTRCDLPTFMHIENICKDLEFFRRDGGGEQHLRFRVKC